MASWEVVDSSGDGLLSPSVSFLSVIHLALCGSCLCTVQLFTEEWKQFAGISQWCQGSSEGFLSCFFLFSFSFFPFFFFLYASRLLGNFCIYAHENKSPGRCSHIIKVRERTPLCSHVLSPEEWQLPPVSRVPLASSLWRTVCCWLPVSHLGQFLFSICYMPSILWNLPAAFPSVRF